MSKASNRLTLNPTLQPYEADKLGQTLWWQDPETGQDRSMVATELELVVLRMATDGISEAEAAEMGNVATDVVALMVDQVVEQGLVMAPEPGIYRTEEQFPLEGVPWGMKRCGYFTLQWHLTNACDLHCAHCYDRTKLQALRLPDALNIVNQFTGFLRHRRMAGEFCLSGGNPLLYKWFTPLYEAVAETGHDISILGNPTTRQELEQLVEIARPTHFQVSLEGLGEHNDRIRGAGHFERVMEFLPILRDLGIEAGVMLTLTSANMDQVLPLAELLRDKADAFTFNRLAQVGQGASLAIPSGPDYAQFLKTYEEGIADNPVAGFKDNLFNVLRHGRSEYLIHGCTGFGCGAAFNFVAVLPDGEVHACRKFPSPIGNVLTDGLEAAYQSAEAERYRQGCKPCYSCPIRAWCGGCLAVSHGAGLDPFNEVDPHCTFETGRT